MQGRGPFPIKLSVSPQESFPLASSNQGLNGAASNVCEAAFSLHAEPVHTLLYSCALSLTTNPVSNGTDLITTFPVLNTKTGRCTPLVYLYAIPLNLANNLDKQYYNQGETGLRKLASLRLERLNSL